MNRAQKQSRQALAPSASHFSGEGEIRTRGTLAGTLVFETSTIGHSVTSPDGNTVGGCRGNRSVSEKRFPVQVKTHRKAVGLPE